uniref:C2 domain-containing protein n=1 Tax=Strigamia maritima TaxID=126957 RepID=T1J5H1_STRMM
MMIELGQIWDLLTCYLTKYLAKAKMEQNEIILTVVLSTLAALVSMGLTFLLCYWCSRRKHKRRGDELESMQFMLSQEGGTNKDGGKDGRGNNTDQSPSGKGSLKLKSPFIKTKPVKLENSPNSQDQSNGQPKAQSSTARDVVGAMQFWQNRSLSQLDMFIDQSEPTENCGQIQFSLEYDFPTSTLILKIMQAKEIPAKDLSGTSDPYVRVTLLPDKKHRLETKIKRRTLHPRWNETFYFEGFPVQKLQNRVLHLHVFDYDRFSRDDSIGEVHVPLCQVDLSEKPVFWKALKPLLKDKCGELLVSLCYHPTNSQLTITIVKARNLKAKDITGKSDPYVKVWLQHGDKKVEKKKTFIIKRSLNPSYNESFTFNVPWERLRETSLLVSVMDFDSVGRNELIGKILLCSKGGVTESKHWNEMINKPRQAITQWHRLKPE